MLETISVAAANALPMILAALTLVFTVLGSWLATKGAAFLNAKLRAEHITALKGALIFVYNATEKISEETKTEADDKARIALKLLADQLGRKLTKTETAAAKAFFAERAIAKK